MRKTLLMAMLLLVAATAEGATRLKCIKLVITNPTDRARPAADIVLSIPQLRKVAPDFYAGSQIVTATDAATLQEDAAAVKATELPSQIDAVDSGTKANELAFQINVAPHQTRVVTIPTVLPTSSTTFEATIRRAPTPSSAGTSRVWDGNPGGLGSGSTSTSGMPLISMGRNVPCCCSTVSPRRGTSITMLRRTAGTSLWSATRSASGRLPAG